MKRIKFFNTFILIVTITLLVGCKKNISGDFEIGGSEILNMNQMEEFHRDMIIENDHNDDTLIAINLVSGGLSIEGNKINIESMGYSIIRSRVSDGYSIDSYSCHNENKILNCSKSNNISDGFLVEDKITLGDVLTALSNIEVFEVIDEIENSNEHDHYSKYVMLYSFEKFFSETLNLDNMSNTIFYLDGTFHSSDSHVVDGTFFKLKVHCISDSNNAIYEFYYKID